jgi:probable rRNA maturation factor
MSIELELQIATQAQTLPHPAQIREWVGTVLANHFETAQLTIRIVDEAESAELNERFLGKQGPTNVISFPYEPIPGIPDNILGDIVICAPLVVKEADEQDKTILAHWAHLVIHGLLHLLGYDHQTDKEAEEMEKLEVKILKKLKFPSPYGVKK